MTTGGDIHEAGAGIPRGSGEQLGLYIDGLLAASDAESANHFSVPMARNLVARISMGGNPVTPVVFSVGIETLIEDCTGIGIDRFTQEKLPSDVVGRDLADYLFFRSIALELARGAFGDPYGDALTELYRTTPDKKS